MDLLACNYTRGVLFRRSSRSRYCTERGLRRLSFDQVTVTRVDHGVFKGDQRYAIQCGTLAAEAFYNNAGATIALMIEGNSTGMVPAVPADTAFRLYKFPLTRIFASEGNRAVRSIVSACATTWNSNSAWLTQRENPRGGIATAGALGRVLLATL
jgi:hypothetical protein